MTKQFLESCLCYTCFQGPVQERSSGQVPNYTLRNEDGAVPSTDTMNFSPTKLSCCLALPFCFLGVIVSVLSPIFVPLNFSKAATASSFCAK